MYHYLIGPAVGAVIGYITNDIAIRMLFRPHQAKYIMGIHVPFTPGIIPKEKARIAGAIGKAVSENLMNREVLEKSLLSDDMLKKISNAIDEFVTTQSGNDETIEQFALHYLSSDDINAMRSDVTGGIVKLVTAKLQNSDLGSSIAHMATEHVMEKTRNSLAGRLGAEMFIQPLAQPIEKILAKHINEILQNNSQQMIQDLVNKEASELMGMTMSQLTTGRDEQVEQIKRGVLNAYRTIIIEHLPRILQDIDISTIIEQRINEMDMNEAEAIIMDVMKKELRAIVWLGALLGCIMGTINALI
ncbi:MAG: DUF445 family protein [Muribaculaceae bacterium]|jgi:uncharacterized membrane protein YheB (UPF0754 family)|nr:DUF445 family protein [Muribaculaceae bacterium]